MSIFSCKHENKNDTKNVEEISENINQLEKILDFSIYRPEKVKYKYIFMDNSGKNQRLTVPGPSDYYLEALLEFDSITFNKMNDFEREEQFHNKEEFNFEWLSKSLKKELNNSPSNYKGHPDFFFKSGINGKAWYLYKSKKILLKTNSS